MDEEFRRPSQDEGRCLMSEKHTQGRLVVRGGFSIYADEGKTPVADTCLTASVPDNDEANARRLVACWNACQGVPTEVLEGGLVADQLWGHLTAQRGTLLAALRCAIKKAPELITVPSIRSAIENAEGGK